MVVLIVSLFVIYSVGCILDGPDMGNGDITGFVRKIAAKQMLKAAEKADRSVYFAKFAPTPMPPRQEFEVRIFEQTFGASFEDIYRESFRFINGDVISKEIPVMIFKSFLEDTMRMFSRDLAKHIIDSKCFKCTLLEPSSSLPLRVSFSIPIAVPKNQAPFEETAKTSVCDVTLKYGLDLKEVLEYMMEGGPYMNPIKRYSNADKA